MKLKHLDREAKEFIERLEDTLPALQAELDLVYQEVKLDTKEELIRKLEIEGRVLVMRDKNILSCCILVNSMSKSITIYK